MVDWTERFSKIAPKEDSFGAEAPQSVARVKGIEKLGKSDLAALNATAKQLGMNVDWLAAVMSFETAGTFSPSILNQAGSGAFGLIQFMPKTAAAILKYPDTPEGRAAAVKKGRAMSFQRQLKEMVVPYFKGGTYRNLNDVYLRVFYPVAMGKPDTYVVGTAPSAVYTQNKGFDRNEDGSITRGEITTSIGKTLAASVGLPRINITTGQWASALLGIGLLGAGAYYLSVNTNLMPFGPNAKKPVGV